MDWISWKLEQGSGLKEGSWGSVKSICLWIFSNSQAPCGEEKEEEAQIPSGYAKQSAHSHAAI